MRLLTRYFFSLLCIATPVSADLANSQFCAAAGQNQQKLRFTDVYEPSTVVQLSDGLILIAEDEGSHPLLISQLIESENGLKLEPVRLKKRGSAVDDLEGSALGKDGAVYLITSHS